MLFGGAFDPPHNGHLAIAHAITEQKIADQIWFVPCAQHPFGKNMSTASDRLAMLRIADSLQISEYELDKKSMSYTIDTLEHFAATLPEHNFSWLIGSDQLPSFTKWHRWENLLTNFTVYVYPREGFPFVSLQNGMVALRNLPLVTISSTKVRELVKAKQPISNLVSLAVSKYIQQKALYV